MPVETQARATVMKNLIGKDKNSIKRFECGRWPISKEKENLQTELGTTFIPYTITADIWSGMVGV